MLIFVVTFNLTLALFNLYLVYRLWRLRRQLALIADTLTRVERRIHRTLTPAPAFIFQGHKGVAHFKDSYQAWLFYSQRLQKIGIVMQFSWKIWRIKSRQL